MIDWGILTARSAFWLAAKQAYYGVS